MIKANTMKLRPMQKAANLMRAPNPGHRRKGIFYEIFAAIQA